MRRIVIESPYAGDIEANTTYARMCMRDALERVDAPIASHLLYTQPGILDEFNPDELQWGIEAGFAWWDAAEKVVFYADRGWSKGMYAAWAKASKEHKPIEMRLLK